MIKINKHKLDVRKENILNILKRDKSTTMDKLAEEVNVSIRTIRTDVAYLKNAIPGIKTRRGKYGGGIYIEQQVDKS